MTQEHYAKGKVIGFLKFVPEIKLTKNQKKYCLFQLGVKTGSYSDDYSFLAFSEKAEEISKLPIMTIIEVVFHFKNNTYTRKDGTRVAEMFAVNHFTSKITVLSKPDPQQAENETAEEIEDVLPF